MNPSDIKPPAQSPSSNDFEGQSGVKEKVKRNTRKITEQVRHQTSGMVENQKNAVADQIGNLASAFHKAADHMGDPQGNLAQYAHSFAGSLDDMAQALHAKDIGALLDQTKDFARRRPAIFVGAAVAAGFLLARFLKSSDPSSDRRSHTATDHASKRSDIYSAPGVDTRQ